MSDNKVKQLRVDKGLSQTELAMMVGVSRLTIYNIEQGIHTPGVAVALKLAKIFNLDVVELFGLG